jgi:hypothetical protein
MEAATTTTTVTLERPPVHMAATITTATLEKFQAHMEATTATWVRPMVLMEAAVAAT